MSLRICLLAAALLLTACSEPDANTNVPENPEAAQALTSAKPRGAGELLVKLHQPLASSRFEAAGYTLQPVKEIGPHLWLMRLEGGLELHDADTLAADTLQAVTALAGDPRVAAVSENSYIPYALVPTDPLYPAQIWNYDTSIRLPLAWDITTGKSSVRIAILDSGRTEHPDITWGPGKDFIDGDDVPTAAGTYHHGIHVAGIAGARPNNGIGGVGVCWGCTIMPWRTGDNLGNLRSAIAEALYWAGGQIVPGQNGPRRADVVNMSMSEKASCNLSGAFAVRDAIDFAVTQGVVVVVAAGNFGRTYDAQFPANCNGQTIAVAASAPGGALASYSTQGARIDITAPGGAVTVMPDIGVSYWGEDIGVPCPRYTTVPPYPADPPWVGTAGVVSTWTAATVTPGPWDHCYRYLTGTSMATPHVSGVIGLMLSVNPALTPAQIEGKLRATARPMSSTECPGGGCGGGMLDAYAAVLSARAFDVTPAELAFGDVLAGGMQDRTVTVTNYGTMPVTVLGVSSSSAVFAGGGPLPGPIAPGTSASLTVRFQPTSAVSYTGTLSIATSSGVASVALSGRGVEPQISVSPAPLAFGDVRVGSSLALTLSIQNIGTAPLTVFGASSTSTAFTVPGPLPGPIAPGASASLTVRIQPPSAASYSGTLSITSDGGGLVLVGLSGRGVEPRISVSPTSLAFGTILVGTSRSQSFTVSNTGTAPLLVSSSSLTGLDFQLSTPTPFSVAPGSSQSVTVACAPATTGSRTGTLVLQHDAGAPVSISLSCNATAGQLQLVEPLNGMVLYSSQSGSATIRNTGVGPLTVWSLRFGTKTSYVSIRGISLPRVLAPGATLSWVVDCGSTTNVPAERTTMLVTHDGVPTGSLFNITCYPGIVTIPEPPPPPPPQTSISATSGTPAP